MNNSEGKGYPLASPDRNARCVFEIIKVSGDVELVDASKNDEDEMKRAYSCTLTTLASSSVQLFHCQDTYPHARTCGMTDHEAHRVLQPICIYIHFSMFPFQRPRASTRPYAASILPQIYRGVMDEPKVYLQHPRADMRYINGGGNILDQKSI